MTQTSVSILSALSFLRRTAARFRVNLRGRLAKPELLGPDQVAYRSVAQLIGAEAGGALQESILGSLAGSIRGPQNFSPPMRGRRIRP
jgi:hypothetical protein